MPGKLRKISRKVFLVFNIIIVVLYLLVCLVPFLPPGKFWFISMLGLVFPFLLFLVFIFMIILVFMKSRWAFLSLAALAVSWQQLSVTFAFRSEKKFSIEKPEGTLRVLSWNVNRWDEENKAIRGGASFRSLMMDLIQMEGPDVLCLQEFFECNDPKYFESNIPVLEKMGYSYHYFFCTSNEGSGVFQNGMIIFSRYPIIDSAKDLIGATEHPEGLCYADIKMQNRVFRVFTTHLQSVRFDKQDYAGIGRMERFGNMLNKIKSAYQPRGEKAKLARQIIEASPYPAIVCADIDDVPNSYAYFKVKGKLQDTFLKKGSGFGQTLNFISPTLRIDYIFADKKLPVTQYTRLKVPYSDHYPIIADLNYGQ